MASGLTRAPLYTREILHLAASIGGQASFAEFPDAPEVRSPTCGSRMRVAVTVDAEGRVATLRQAVEACAFGQASAALMGEGAVGKRRADVQSALEQLDAWLAGTSHDEPWPGFAALELVRARPGRHGAVLLPFRALLAAIEAAAR